MATTTSYTNTPQATTDTYGFTESQLLESVLYDPTREVITLDVMANDLGGNGKTLYSVDGDMDGLTELLQRDAAGAWETARIALWTQGEDTPAYHDILVRTCNGKVEVDLSGAMGAGGLADLTADQTLRGSFVYAIQLGNGTLSYATINFIVTGEGQAQDQPAAIGGAIAGAVTETNAVMHTGGLLTISDPEGQDTFQAQAHVAGSGGHGFFTLQADGAWTYTTYDSMDWMTGGLQLTDSFIAKAADDTEQLVTVTITGTDDRPVVTAADLEGHIVEGVGINPQGQQVASGAFTLTDPDLMLDIQIGEIIAPAGAPGTLAVTRVLTPDTLSFQWTYTVDASAVEELGMNDGQSLPLNFEVQLLGSTDPHLGSFAIQVTLDGANEGGGATVNEPPFLATDIADFDPATGFSGAITEDDTAALTWFAILGDPDGADESTFRVTGLEDGQVGSFAYDRTSSTWTYTLDARAQALPLGQSVDEHYMAVSYDGSLSIPINVHVEGRDDPAQVRGTLTGELSEDDPPVEGQITITDIDGDGYLLGIRSMDAAYGAFALETDGHWTYTPDPVLTLALGNTTVYETMNFGAFGDLGSGGTYGTVTVTLHGIEDAAAPLVGTEGDDLLTGTDFGENINALGGNDVVFAGLGNDTVHGGDGDDVIWGQAGDDVLYADTGNDVLVGGLGDDALFLGEASVGVLTRQGVDILHGVTLGTRIQLDAAYFTEFATSGTLTASQFSDNPFAPLAQGMAGIVYDGASGAVYYDPDGSSGFFGPPNAPAVLVATVANPFTAWVTADTFFVA
ncbi:VCBS domain-containing protein [Ramlibacter sp. MAHUQ-53]|uniref:VCBS domain-containing protein n=1 Tax=unclassified Ramlibacter TaxID=2617605 RepID=UPI0036397C05